MIDHQCDLPRDQLQGFLKQKEVRIADDVLRGRTKVDDAQSIRGGLPVGMDVCHDIMSKRLLMGRCSLEVDVLERFTKLANLVFRDLETKFVLCLGQREPDPTPGRDAFSRRKELGHFRRRAASGQWRLVDVVLRSDVVSPELDSRLILPAPKTLGSVPSSSLFRFVRCLQITMKAITSPVIV